MLQYPSVPHPVLPNEPQALPSGQADLSYADSKLWGTPAPYLALALTSAAALPPPPAPDAAPAPALVPAPALAPSPAPAPTPVPASVPTRAPAVKNNSEYEPLQSHIFNPYIKNLFINVFFLNDSTVCVMIRKVKKH